MRAVVISRPGGPEVLEVREVPEPVVGPREVLVDVRATGVNRADLLQRRGRYPAPEGVPPDIPGLEFAGTVAEVGRAVRTIERGDRVMGIVGGGAYAERLVVHEKLCLRIPPALGWEAAAAIPEGFLTAYDALFRCGRMTTDERVLVEAAGSGVGTAAVQLALAGNAQVIGLSRTAAKRAALERIGVPHVFDPGRTDLADRVLEATEGGVDLVVDLVGAAAWPLHRRVLRERGRLVLVGLLGGSKLEIELFDVMRRRLEIVGTVLRSRPLEEKFELVETFADGVLEWIAAGRVTPVVHGVIDLERAADAHALMERNENFGKIVLAVGSDGDA